VASVDVEDQDPVATIFQVIPDSRFGDIQEPLVRWRRVRRVSEPNPELEKSHADLNRKQLHCVKE
jgi:hypothetical protein